MLGALLLCIAIISGIVWAIIAFKDREEPIHIATHLRSRWRKVIFDTNGVLPSRWLGTVIELRRDTSMMEVDIHGMKQQLEAHGQVKSASIERQFPNALKIDIKGARTRSANARDGGE